MPIGAPALTAAHLNRALLARQLLLERASLPIEDAVEQVGGLQTQYAPSGYVGPVDAGRGLPRATDGGARAPFDHPGDPPARHDPHGLRARVLVVRARHPQGPPSLVRPGATGAEEAGMREAADRLRAAWLTDPDGEGARQHRGRLRGYLGLWLDLVRVPPSGTWDRRRADLLARPTRGSARDATEAVGLAHLVRAYLAPSGRRRGRTSRPGRGARRRAARAR